MSLDRIGVIYRKELRDTLRDRRTIISTIVLPILMFPLLTLGFSFVATRSIRDPVLWEVEKERIAAVAAYVPLNELAAVDALLARSWSAPIDGLLAQQIRAPREEAAGRENLPRLTPIGQFLRDSLQLVPVLRRGVLCALNDELCSDRKL